jgi:cardiolipin synthase A/B
MNLNFLIILRLSTMLCIPMIGSCVEMPSLLPDMAMQSPHTLQLKGKNGPLSIRKSKAILEKLKQNGVETNIFDRHLALMTEITDSPLVIGNKVELLIDGPTTYDAMFEAIEGAKDHINVETYIFENDEVGNNFKNLLIAKQLSGVQVNLIYDSFGTIYIPKTFFTTLLESGANVLEFNPVNPLVAGQDWDINKRDHRKLLIVDGQVAFVGGVNISSVYSSGSFGSGLSSKSQLSSEKQQWRDTHIRISGPVVNDFQKLFIGTWNQQQGEPLAFKNYFPNPTVKGNEVVRAIGSNPDEDYSQMYLTLISAINSAETQISLTNAYFVPDPQMLAALKDAAKRGVDVRLLLPDKTDSNMVYYASRSFYDELLSANVKIFELHNALLHAKTMLIDGVWSTVGSTNLDWRSFTSNQEIDAVVLGPNFGAQMQVMYENDLKASKKITLEEWGQRSIISRIKERAARFWARFL